MPSRDAGKRYASGIESCIYQAKTLLWPRHFSPLTLNVACCLYCCVCKTIMVDHNLAKYSCVNALEGLGASIYGFSLLTLVACQGACDRTDVSSHQMAWQFCNEVEKHILMGIAISLYFHLSGDARSRNLVAGPTDLCLHHLSLHRSCRSDACHTRSSPSEFNSSREA